MTAAPARAFQLVTHALYQARIWREYARTFDGVRTSTGVDSRWVEGVLRMTRRQCLDRAWEAARAARSLQVDPAPDAP